MTEPLIRSERPLALLGGGPVDPADLATVAAEVAGIVAADGGVAHLKDTGLTPLAVIGDMDSADSAILGHLGVPVHPVAEQDSTDLEKCLRAVEAPLILGLGFLGGRVDHHLASMNALVKFAGQPLILVGRADVCFHCPPDLQLDLEPGARVSLFPMAPVIGTVSEGLRWSVEGLAMRPDGQIGTSNMALGGPVRFGFDRPGALVILPRRVLRQVVEALVPALA